MALSGAKVSKNAEEIDLLPFLFPDNYGDRQLNCPIVYNIEQVQLLPNRGVDTT